MDFTLLPQDVLKYILELYEGLLNRVAARIQLFYARYKGWMCEDCRAVVVKHKLRRSHACDDMAGCCYKYVCPDHCTFYCCNGHEHQDHCPEYFCYWYPSDDDEYPDDLRKDHDSYVSRFLTCQYCGEAVYVNRNFNFGVWARLRYR